MKITLADNASIISHNSQDKLARFKSFEIGVNAIIPSSPKPKINEIINNLFLNIFDLNMLFSVLTDSKKNSCKRFKV